MNAASVTPADLTITPRDRRFVDKVRPAAEFVDLLVDQYAAAKARLCG